MSISIKDTSYNSVQEKEIESKNSISKFSSNKDTEKIDESKKGLLGDIFNVKLSCYQILNLISLCIANVSTLLTMSVMSPFFPKEAELKGVSEISSGLIFGIFPFTIFLSSPYISGLVTYFGARNSLVFGLVLVSISNAIFGCFMLIDTSWLFVLCCLFARIVEGLGSAIAEISTVSIAFILFPSNVGTTIGLVNISTLFGLSFGPVIGGLIYEYGGITLPFWCISITLLFAAIFEFYSLKSISNNESKNESKDETNEDFENWTCLMSKTLSFIANISVLVVLFSVWLTATAWSYLSPILEPYLRNRFGKTPAEVGYEFFMVQAIFYALFSPIWGAISDNSSKKWIFLSIGLFGLSLSSFMLAPLSSLLFPDTEIFKVFSLVVFGLSAGIFITPSFTALFSIAIDLGYEDNTRTYALISGLWRSGFALGETTGPLISAALVEYYSFKIAIASLGFFSLLTGLLFTMHFAGAYKKHEKINAKENPSIEEIVSKESKRILGKSQNDTYSYGTHTQ